MKHGMRLAIAGTMAVVLCLLAELVRSDAGERNGGSPVQAHLLFQNIVGNPDPAAVRNTVRYAGVNQILKAVYGGNRSERLIALDALASCEDAWSVMPYLAALITARDRQVANRSAQSLLVQIARIAAEANSSRGAEVVRGQVEQLARELASTARDLRFDVDLRAAAIEGLRVLQLNTKEAKEDLLDLLDDPDPAISIAVLRLISLPLKNEELMKLAAIASKSDQSNLSGQAAHLLCENAHAHAVEEPSADLVKILRDVLARPQMAADVVVPIAICLKRFPSSTHADLFHLIEKHPDPAVAAYLKSLDDAFAW